MPEIGNLLRWTSVHIGDYMKLETPFIDHRSCHWQRRELDHWPELASD